MKKAISVVCLLLVLVSCNRKNNSSNNSNDNPGNSTVPVDTVVMPQVYIDNILPTIEDSIEYTQALSARRRPVPKPKPTPVIIPTGTYVIYVNVKGGTVTSEYWNNGQTFTVEPSLMTAYEFSFALDKAQRIYAPYNVIITDSVEVYNRATKKMIVYVCPRPAFMPPGASGYSFVGTLSTSTPAFVFSDLLYNIGQYVGSIVAHELGHSVGMRHQSVWDASCVLTNPYRPNTCMGNGLYDDLPPWITGTTPVSCTSSQNDHQILTNVLGVKANL